MELLTPLAASLFSNPLAVVAMIVFVYSLASVGLWFVLPYTALGLRLGRLFAHFYGLVLAPLPALALYYALMYSAAGKQVQDFLGGSWSLGGSRSRDLMILTLTWFTSLLYGVWGLLWINGRGRPPPGVVPSSTSASLAVHPANGAPPPHLHFFRHCAIVLLLVAITWWLIDTAHEVMFEGGAAQPLWAFRLLSIALVLAALWFSRLPLHLTRRSRPFCEALDAKAHR